MFILQNHWSAGIPEWRQPWRLGCSWTGHDFPGGDQTMLGRIVRAYATARIAGSTLFAYVKIGRVIVNERLWKLPERQRRLAGAATIGAMGDARVST